MVARSQGIMAFRLPRAHSTPQLHPLPRQFVALESASTERQCKGLSVVGKGRKKQLTSRTTFAKLFTLDQGEVCVPLQQCWCYSGIDHAGHDEEILKPKRTPFICDAANVSLLPLRYFDLTQKRAMAFTYLFKAPPFLLTHSPGSSRRGWRYLKGTRLLRNSWLLLDIGWVKRPHQREHSVSLPSLRYTPTWSIPRKAFLAGSCLFVHEWKRWHPRTTNRKTHLLWHLHYQSTRGK